MHQFEGGAAFLTRHTPEQSRLCHAGNRLTRRTRRGETLTFDYDDLNRMTVKVVPERSGLDPIHTRDVYYGYDLRGLQTFARFGSGGGEGVSQSWDGFGRLLSSSIDMGGVTRTLEYVLRCQFTKCTKSITVRRWPGSPVSFSPAFPIT